MPYHFEADLTARDCKRHLPHVFTVPASCAALRLHLRFAPYQVHGVSNMLTLTLFDPQGFRGAGHRGGAEHHVHLSATAATPGYLAGPLPAGTWIAQVDTHMVMPGAPLHYTLEIALEEGAAHEVAPPATAHQPEADATRPPRGAGWYRGDLHSHSDHSDADDRSVVALVQSAREEGLDYIFLTDHNTTTGLQELAALSSGALLPCGGVELTTFWGHALCLGAREWVDWRVRPAGDGMARLAAAAQASGQVFIIAHPQSVGDPTCTGCAWRYGEMMPGAARLVEVWNGPWGGDSGNEAALALWYDWLNQGYRLVATAGTDTHWGRDYIARPGFSVIHAAELTEAALLAALRAGHLYLSAGPQLFLQAQDASGAAWLPGDAITTAALFTVAWEAAPPEAQVRLIVNGRLLDTWPAGVRGEMAWELTPQQAAWVTVELRGAAGEMLALSNPIYLDAEQG
jgi:hypothetical protein